MIYKYPHKILFTRSDDVTFEEGLKIDELLREEGNKLDQKEMVGLAAPQIGLNKRVFLALDKTYFNAYITWYSESGEIKEEGCFSLKSKKYDYKIWRAKSIKMKWINMAGKEKEGFFMGFQAQVLQHEFDHLEGKLCCQN